MTETAHGYSVGAWSLNANGTITSAMDGKCLQRSGGAVTVGACTGTPGQRWAVNAGEYPVATPVSGLHET